VTSNDTVAYLFAEYAGGPDAHRMSRAHSGNNVFVSRSNPRDLHSYGYHYTLARIMLDQHGQRAWWLLNGDGYSPSTTRHQTITRTHCQRTGLPCLIVPFTALDEAGIRYDTITPLDIQKERHDERTHYADHYDEVPDSQQDRAVQLDDGRWKWVTYRHWLGAALFAADYEILHGWDNGHRNRHTGRAWFLSAFDEQETRPHYFLAQLPYDDPDEPGPATVEDALRWLKPAAVLDAEERGALCTRQGDLFAVPTDLTTRQVATLGQRTKRTHVTVSAVDLDGNPQQVTISHTATEVVHGSDGNTYARGVLYHAPTEWGRDPEHKRQRMGDGRTWHRLVKNTVPVGLHTTRDNRAWSRGGNVD
jgi:hypothetical protein